MTDREIEERLAEWYGARIAVDDRHRDRVTAAALEIEVRRSPPIRWVIAAACAAALVVGAVLVGQYRSAPRRDSLAMVDVRFVLRGEPTAARVAVVGDFNGWNVTATPLDRAASHDGWAGDVRMRPGRYGYAFVVDGRQWIADPTAPLAPDVYGRPTSVIIVETRDAQ